MLRVVLCVAGGISAARGVIVSVLSGQITSEPPAFFNIATAAGAATLALIAVLLRIMNSNEKVRARKNRRKYERENAL